VQRAFVGLGSNLDDPTGQVRRALLELAQLAESRLLRHSGLYRSPPMGPQDQPPYVNAVAMLQTALAPLELLDALQALERAHGRRRTTRWGPRTLDLDLLLYGDLQIEHPRLRVPHPGMAQRAFVLVPMAEIAPDLEIPGLGVLRAVAVDGSADLERIDPAG
jgi:2-amino-4-hydroxy-6-hydroxymethyldihydropteridine diphosphokinase